MNIGARPVRCVKRQGYGKHGHVHDDDDAERDQGAPRVSVAPLPSRAPQRRGGDVSEGEPSRPEEERCPVREPRRSTSHSHEREGRSFDRKYGDHRSERSSGTGSKPRKEDRRDPEQRERHETAGEMVGPARPLLRREKCVQQRLHGKQQRRDPEDPQLDAAGVCSRRTTQLVESARGWSGTPRSSLPRWIGARPAG